MSLDLQERKNQLREQAHANRKAQPDKEEVSQRIVERLVARPEYAAAKAVMYYIDVRTEVKTRHALPDALSSGKRIVVPYCVEGELELFLLESMEELSVGMYKILEPWKISTWSSCRASPSTPGAPGWGTAWATTTSCWSMPGPTRR